MQKPKPVTVGELVARAARPPIASDPRWWWRCRQDDPATQRQVWAWTDRGTRSEVEEALVALRDSQPKPTVQRVAPSQLKTIAQLLDA